MAVLLRIEGELKLMASKIQEWAEQQEADLEEINSTLEGIGQGIVDLDKKITEFQNSPGQISAADQAFLDAIQTKSKALVTKAQAIKVDATDGQGQPPTPTAPAGGAVAGGSVGPTGQPQPAGPTN